MQLPCNPAQLLVAVLTIGTGVLFVPRQSFAQAESPSDSQPQFGGHGESQSTDLRVHEWQVAVDYRYLHADRYYVGSQQTTPGHNSSARPLIINVQSANFNVTYAASDRVSVRLTVPVSYGSQSRFYADTARHVARAGGIGDIGLVGTAWLLNPRTHPKGNVALGAGVKAPTGNYRFTDRFFLANGSSVEFPWISPSSSGTADGA